MSVASLSADNVAGLSYNNLSTDSEGFGTYTISIDRSSIPDGEFSNTIYFNLSDGEKVAVRIYYDVGSTRSRPDIGKVYIGVYDASDNSLWGSGELETNGSVSFQAEDVGSGDYYILTSTDIDNDNFVCDYGELCEYYPQLDETTYFFTISDDDVSGYEIFLKPIIKYGGINAASVSTSDNQENYYNKSIKEKLNNGVGKIVFNPIPITTDAKKTKQGYKTFNTN